MKLHKLTLVIVLLTVIQGFSQIAPDKYYIQFTDKNNSPYSIDNPEEFLTQRAINRRVNQGIEIIENDLPVNPQYLLGVANEGAVLLNPTKWLNGVTILTTSQNVLDNILRLWLSRKIPSFWVLLLVWSRHRVGTQYQVYDRNQSPPFRTTRS